MRILKNLLRGYLLFAYLSISNLKVMRKIGLANVPATRFVIISRSRTGSTMLISYLRKIPGSLVLGEILGKKRLIPCWKRVPELFFGNHWKSRRLVGFKYFYYHPIDDWDSSNLVLEFLMQNPDIKIIHWVREDLFATLISRFIAVETDHWRLKNKSTELADFEINIARFKCELEKTLANIALTRNLLASMPNYKEISYEDIVERGKLKELYAFLGYPEIPIHYDTRSSQNSSKKYNKIKNIDVLRQLYLERITREQ